MRTFKPFLLFAFLLAACSPAFSQTPPDCTFTFTAQSSSGPVTGSPVSNLYTNVSSNPIKTACTAWTYKYSADNASAVSIQLEGAADALTGSTHAPSGSYSALTASTATGSGTNPSTVATNAGVVLCCDFYPWVRINIITLTPVSGTAHISGTVYGYKTNSALNGGGGGGGGGYNTIANAGVALTKRSILNFVNGGCVDDGGSLSTDCTIGGSGGAFLSGASDPGVPAISVKQSVHSTENALSVAFSGVVTAGNLVLVSLGRADGALGNPPTVSDTLNTSFTQLTRFDDGSGHAISVLLGTAVGSGADTITVAWAASGSSWIFGAEIAGQITSIVDTSSSGGSAPTLTLGLANDSVFSSVYGDAGSSPTVTSPEILLQAVSSSFDKVMGLSWQFVPFTGSYTSSINPSTSHAAYASIALEPQAVSSPGNNGDFYLNTLTGVLWGPKTGGVWPLSGFGQISNSETTFTASGCGVSSLVGNATAGSFHSGTNGSCTVAITFGGGAAVAQNGWACAASDLTNPVLFSQTGSTLNTSTINGVTVSGDLILFSCRAF